MKEENNGLEPRGKRARTKVTQTKVTQTKPKTIQDLSLDLLSSVFLNAEANLPPSDLRSISLVSSSFRRAIDPSNITFWRAYSARHPKVIADPKNPKGDELWLLGRRLDTNLINDIDFASLWAFISKDIKNFFKILTSQRFSKNQPLLDKFFRYIIAQYAVKSIPAASQSLNFTILFWAIACNQPEQVRELIKAGAGLALTIHGEMIVLNAEQSTNMCIWVLNIAAKNDFAEVVQALIDGGVSAQLSHPSQTPPLFLALNGSSHATAEILLTNGADSNVYNQHGSTPLMVAAKKNDKVMAELLLKHLAFADAYRKAEAEETALHIATNEGHYDIVKLLLHHGANSNLTTKKEKGTPLHIAALKGNLRIASLLALFCNNLDAVDYHGDTALHLALYNKHHDVVRMLVSRGANCDIPNEKGMTPKKIAARYGAKGDAQFIDALTPNDINPNAMIVDGDSLLNFFSRAGKLSLVKKILDSGVNVNDGGPNGVPPICIAAERGHVEIATLLLQSGANSDCTNNRGTTPLWVASQSGNLSMVQLLLEHGANPDTRSLQKYDTLIKVAEKISEEAVMRVQKHFEITGTDEAYVSAVEVASLMGHKDMVSLLKQKLRENKVAEPVTKKLCL